MALGKWVYTPLLLDSGVLVVCDPPFKFDMCWLFGEELEIVVQEVWA